MYRLIKKRIPPPFRGWPKLTADIKRPFKLQGMERIDDTPVHKAIREGMTNMIIHADFFVTGVLKVEKYNHELLFSNPGSLKLPIEDIMCGGNSKARNPRIQNMLRMIGYGDNIGSGYPTILKVWKEENWRKPTLLDRTELRQVDLTLPMISLLPENVLHEMEAHYGEMLFVSLTAEEQIIAAYVWNGESVSNAELQQLLGLNSIEVGKILHGMVEKQLLNQENKNRWTTYTICKERVGDKKGDKKSDKKNAMELTDTEQQILALMRLDASVTYSMLEKKLSLGRTTLFKAISHLKEIYVVSREGGRKNGHWVIR